MSLFQLSDGGLELSDFLAVVGPLLLRGEAHVFERLSVAELEGGELVQGLFFRCGLLVSLVLQSLQDSLMGSCALFELIL